MDEAEIEARWFLNRVDDFGIVLGADSGELHLDAVVANRADDGFGDTKLIYPVADDLDSLGEILFALVFVYALGDTVVLNFEDEGDTALEIETELQAPLGLLQEVVEQDSVALLDVNQRSLEANLRKELGEIDSLRFANFLEGKKYGFRLVSRDHLASLGHNRFELGDIR